MKRLVWLACAVLVASLPAIGAAQETKKSEGKASGVVASVTGTSLVVKGTQKEAAGEWTFQITEKTEVIGRGAGTKSRAKAAEGQKTTILDFVAAGDTVEVTYQEAGSAKTARTVRVTKKGT